MRLSAAAAAAIRAHALADYPREACGLLIGPAGPARAIDQAVPSTNRVPPDCHDRFEIDMGLYLRLQRELRGSGRGILGIYHSHPDGPASPSARDAEAAWSDHHLWLIVRVAGGAVETVTGWQPLGHGRGFAPIRLEEEP